MYNQARGLKKPRVDNFELGSILVGAPGESGLQASTGSYFSRSQRGQAVNLKPTNNLEFNPIPSGAPGDGGLYTNPGSHFSRYYWDQTMNLDSNNSFEFDRTLAGAPGDSGLHATPGSYFPQSNWEQILSSDTTDFSEYQHSTGSNCSHNPNLGFDTHDPQNVLNDGIVQSPFEFERASYFGRNETRTDQVAAPTIDHTKHRERFSSLPEPLEKFHLQTPSPV